MDLEISKIWEEALRYAAPLPVPEAVTSTISPKSLDILSSSDDANNNNSSICIMNSTDNMCLDTSACRVYSKDNSHTANERNETWKSKQTEVDSIKQSLIEALCTSDQLGQNILNHDTEVDGLKNIGVDLAKVIRNSKAIGESPKTPTLNTSGSVSADAKIDTSEALSAGLKMIQQGNELIAMALKCSNNAHINTNFEGESPSPSMSVFLDSISMPSSVDSFNIPSVSDMIGVENSDKQTDSLQPTSDHGLKPVLSFTDTISSAVSPFSYESENSIQDSKCSEPKVKRRRKREKNPNPSPCSPILPPCQICDEKSSGFHYGANTCEACKGFFRRTLKKSQITFQCKCTESDKLVWKQGPNKNGCPACRYARCLTVGMSKNAIKIGRYTLNRKTENILKVKSLEAMDSVIEKAILSTAFPDYSLSNSDSPTSGSGISSPEGMAMLESPPLTDTHSCSTTSAIVSSPDSKHPQLTVMEIESVISDLTEAHKANLVFSPLGSKEEVNKRHKQFLVDYKLKEEVFGQMNLLSKAEYKEFFNATGIDVDGRQQAMQEALQYFTKRIGRVVEYAKVIPGFTELSLKDQASLIKYSRPEHRLIAGYRAVLLNVSKDLQVATTPWGREVHLNEVTKIISEEVINSRYKNCLLLQSLDLSYAEEAILRGIVITFTDRTELEDQNVVQEIQNNLIVCLEYLLNERPEEKRISISKVLDILVRFREFTETEYKMTKELVFDWPCLARNPLLRELLT